MPAGQITQAQIPDADTSEFFYVVADVVKHSADLAIDSLTQNDAYTRGSKLVQSQNFRALAIKENSAQKFRRQRRIPQTIEHDFIFFFDLMSRMNEALGKVAVVSEKDESFTLGIEPADMK